MKRGTGNWERGTVLCALCVLCGLNLAASTVINKVMMVDEKGETNAPEALATTADMAAIKAAVITTEEKASAAEAAARHGTNLVKDVVADIGRNELVIYRYGYTDGISAAQVLDPDAQLVISEFSPLDEQNAAGLQAFEIEYALKNSTEYQGQPIIRWRGALDDGTDFEPIEAANIEPVVRLDGSWTNSAGIVYQYQYQTKFFDAAGGRGFYLVNLIPDDTAGDGAAMELPNGVKGGLTLKVNWGGYELEITGGIVTGVK